jgi:hypothetical protein
MAYKNKLQKNEDNLLIKPKYTILLPTYDVLNFLKDLQIIKIYENNKTLYVSKLDFAAFF